MDVGGASKLSRPILGSAIRVDVSAGNPENVAWRKVHLLKSIIFQNQELISFVVSVQ